MTRSTSSAAITKSRFEAGPARVTRFSSRTILRKLRVMTGRGLGPAHQHSAEQAEPEERPEDHEGRKQQRADGVDVVHGVERDAAFEAGGLIAQQRRRPGMRALMKAQRKDEQNELENGNEEGGGLQTNAPWYRKAQVSMGARAGSCLVGRELAHHFARLARWFRPSRSRGCRCARRRRWCVGTSFTWSRSSGG